MSVNVQPGNADSISPRLTPRISGLLRFGHAIISTVASAAATASISLPTASRWPSFRPLKSPCVQHQPEARSDVGCTQCRYIAVYERDVDPGALAPVARPLQSFLDEVNTRYLPAPLGQLNRPDPAASRCLLD